VSYVAYSSFIYVLRTTRFLYILYISVDANFKLKGKERNLKDIELMPGWGAYVPDAEFKDHIANHIDEPEVCVLTYPHEL
jgi:hypothetical protein